MKYDKTLAVLAGLTFAGSLAQAQIAVGDNLTISGFVDASYSQTEHVNAITEEKDKTLGVDEVEVNFDFSFDGVSASVHLESKGGEVALEQAYASVNVSGVTLSGGRMLNLLGFESDETTGLLQYSDAYDFGSDDVLTGVDLDRQYSDGIRAAVSQGDFSVAASVFGSLYATDINNDEEVAYEIAATYTGIENLTVSLGYADDNNSDLDGNNTNNNLIASIVNLHASYSLGQITVHGEWNDFEDAEGKDGDSYLLTGTYAINDKAGLTVRYSEVDADGTGSDLEKFTIAPNYALTDNLNTRLEYSTGELGGNDVDVFAVEGILSF